VSPLRALITRPREDAEEIAEQLRARGIESVIEPMLAIVPVPHPGLDLTDVQALLFTSANGVRAFAAATTVRSLPVFAVGDATAAAARIDVYNKIDLAPGFSPPARACPSVAVSATTGAGLEQLRRAILSAAGWTSHGESVFLARERHLRALVAARGHLRDAATQPAQWEFFAEELRLAQRALAGITGEFSADDLLGEIFARFCIGK